MKKIFISQPMRGKSPQEIESDRNRAIVMINRYVKGRYGDDTIEFIDTYFKDFNGNRLDFLGKSITDGLARCDLAAFIGEWNKYDGCLCEHFIASRYGIDILYITGKEE